MCGALLTGEDARIERVPELTDVKTLCALLASCGCSVKKENDALILNAAALQNPQDEEDVRKMRASVLVLGPLLARCLLYTSVRGHFAADERVQCEFKIFRLFQFVGKRLKCFRRDGVEHGVRVGDAAGRRHHAELEFIARKREGRGPVSYTHLATAIPTSGWPKRRGAACRI